MLFIGLPCQVAAVKNYIKNQENLYTIDLICHGTPSIQLLSKYLNERGYALDKLKDIKFRIKRDFGISVNGEKIVANKVTDQYMCAFLESISYTENCYECEYASLERVSDMTLRDSWGSEYKEQEDKGISLILVQTEKGKKLLDISHMELKNVDLNKAISNNQQLVHPSTLTYKRDRFFKMIKKGLSFNLSTFVVLYKMVIKQKIKYILIKFHLY